MCAIDIIMVHIFVSCEDNLVRKHVGRIRMKRIVITVLILLLVAIVGLVASALISYRKQPELTEAEKQKLDSEGIWKERTQAERARIIENNDEALKERIRMIYNAREMLTESPDRKSVV